MFYLSALIAIIGAVSYQFTVKKIPASINPIVSVLASYLIVLVLGFALLLFFPAKGGLGAHVRQISWVQVAVAGAILLLELGFLLMFRYGWNLSTGNLVTGVIINLGLLALGVTVLGEKVSLINAIGIVLSILGVALISYRS